MMASIQELEQAVRATDEWIDDLLRRLQWHDRQKVYLALRSTLHALRDCLPVDEAIYLGAQMPALLRGVCYDGWHPRERPLPLADRTSFLDRIHDGVHREPGIDPEQVAEAVFSLLADRLPSAELEDAKAATPGPLRALWPS
jgi:uncharacterized protein (DUF2267 family)